MTSIWNHNIVQRLIGLTVTSVNVFSDVISLSFGNCWRLAIYNVITIYSNTGKVALGDGRCLIGKTVLDCSTSTTEFVLRLTDEISVHVDLRDEAFSGPEAMQLVGPNGEIVVWN